MRFTKIHEAGSDYLYVDCLGTPPPADPAALSRALCDRHFGAGGGGMVLLCPSERADARLVHYRPDGSEAGAGGGLRGAAKYLYDRGHARRPRLTVEAGGEVLHLEVEGDGRRAARVRLDMGAPVLQADRIPTTLPGNPPVEVPLTWPNTVYNVTCVGLAGPHCVIFVHDVSDQLVRGVGPQMERHVCFPQRTSVEFVRVNRRDDVTVRVWERGAGEAPSSDTGACAIAVAGALTGRTKPRLTVHLPGGDLEADWSEAGRHVLLAGPAVEVYQGDWPSGA